jgi:hypothetical protein
MEISIDEIISYLTKNNASHSRSDKTVALTYRHILEHFQSIETITEGNLIVGIHVIYGWMPTMVKRIDFDSIKDSINALQQVRNGFEISADQIIQVRNVVNNSTVGASKLLHFLAPEHYPIWDSRIFKYIFKGGKKPYKSNLDRIELFQNYRQQLIKISKLKDAEVVQEIITEHCGYKVTKIRALEFAMFLGANQL